MLMLCILHWNTLDALIAMILLIEITFTGIKKYKSTKNHNSDDNDDDEHWNYANGKSDEKFEY